MKFEIKPTLHCVDFAMLRDYFLGVGGILLCSLQLWCSPPTHCRDPQETLQIKASSTTAFGSNSGLKPNDIAPWYISVYIPTAIIKPTDGYRQVSIGFRERCWKNQTLAPGCRATSTHRWRRSVSYPGALQWPFQSRRLHKVLLEV